MQRQMLKSRIHRAMVTGCDADYIGYEERDMETYAPIVVHVDEENRAITVDSHPEVLLSAAEEEVVV